MAKIKTIKARKTFTCGKCGKEVKPGDTYKRGILNFSHDKIRCMECGLQYYEVTTSDYIYRIGEFVHHWTENYGSSSDMVDDTVSELESLRDELEERLDNIPEPLQEGNSACILQERIEQLESVVADLENLEIPEGDIESEEIPIQEEWETLREEIRELLGTL